MTRRAAQGALQHTTRRRRWRRIVVRWVAVVAATVASALAGYGVAYAVDHIDDPEGMRSVDLVFTPAPVCTPEPLPTVLISGSSTMQEWG
ncbi:hypothetical protein ACQUSY_11340 [Microbacterium sp. YY-03]|uniref:hypothetical protein n=1 Tax=Microbacterium sp. YY-03 TaxID=3421636 RepID=UPI003D16DCA5